MERRARVGCWIMGAVPLVLGASVLLAVGLQSPTWRVERTRTVPASPERIRAMVSDVRALASCCRPWGARTPSPPTVFSEPSSGRGAWLEWGEPGERQRGTIETVGQSRVVMRFDVAGRVSRQTVEWRAIGAGGTEVTWTLEGDKSGFVQRLLWPLVASTDRFGAIVQGQLDGLARATADVRATGAAP